MFRWHGTAGSLFGFLDFQGMGVTIMIFLFFLEVVGYFFYLFCTSSLVEMEGVVLFEVCLFLLCFLSVETVH